MKRLFIWIGLGVWLVMATSAQEGSESLTLEQARSNLEAQQTKLDGPLDDLKANYLQRLTSLMNEAQTRGNLDVVLAVRSELANLAKVDYTPAETEIADLQKLQEIYSNARTKLLSERHDRFKLVLADYRTQLTRIERELTQQNQIDQAIAVRKELEQTEQLLEKSAQEAVALAKTKPSEPQPSLKPSDATKDQPYVNGLGMKFVPVSIRRGPSKDKTILFSIWETRVQDLVVFMNDSRRAMESPPFPQGPDHPATRVSLEEARAFCEWLTQRELTENRIKATDAYRIPSDYEWSTAIEIARHEDPDLSPEAKNSQTKIYPWGDSWPPTKPEANYWGEECRALGNISKTPIPGFNDTFLYTAPVGSFPPNSLGLYDISGNVAEWTNDKLDPAHPARIAVRGGSWNDSGEPILLSSRRHWATEFDHHDHIGFRCVLELGP